jgi:hypothetical protein
MLRCLAKYCKIEGKIQMGEGGEEEIENGWSSRPLIPFT